MTWVGWSEWQPPPTHLDVLVLETAWHTDNEFVLFWVARDGAPQYESALYSCNGSVTDAGIFSFGGVTLLETYDFHGMVEKVERTPSGRFGVYVMPNIGD